MPVSISNNNTASPSPAPAWRSALLPALLLAVLALVLYRPWVDRPFDTLDFSEFLPLLTGPHSFGGRLAALTHYYVGEHARLNVLSYAGLAAKWTLLGASPVLWQWARMGEMAVLTAGVYLLFRRLALRPLPALAGASLFVFTRLVSEGWTRMTMGEPLGLICALGALLLATTWRTGSRPILRAAAAGLLMACAVLAKEMLIGVLPLVWLIGTARRADGRLARPDLSGDAKRWIFWSAVPAFAAFGLALVIALGGGSGGFTNLYGQAPTGLQVFFSLASRPWIIQGVRPGFGALTLPGNAFFALVLVGGLWLVSRRAEWRDHLRWSLAGAVGLSFAFAILYLPWPYTYLYYGIPFHLGPALLFGLAIQAISDEGRRGPLVACLGWGAVVATTAPATAQNAAMLIAMQQVNGDLVATIGQVRYADRLVMARVSPAPQPWMGSAATLRRYAMATGAPATFPAATQDLGCPESVALLQQRLGRTVFVSFLGNCGGLGNASAHLAHTFGSLVVTWTSVRWKIDSIAADVLVDREAMAPPVPPVTVRAPGPRTD